MKKLFIFIVLFFIIFCVNICFAEDIYVSQSGGGDGSSCGSSQSVAWFNTAGNWGAGAGKISPGDTVHLCGTFTTSAGASGYLTFQGSGSFGSPITLLFETGAILQAPYWGQYGAIYLSGKSYITIDGGVNGLIQATLNGTSGATCPGGACSYQYGTYGTGLYLNNGTNVEAKNLTIANMYVRTPSSSDTTGGSLHQPWAVTVWGGTNITIDHNVFHDMQWAIWVLFASGSQITGLDINNNEIYNVSVGIGGGDGSAGGVLTNANIYNNYIHDFGKWDEPGDTFHHDGIYIWVTSSGSSISGTYNVYNNFIYDRSTYCSAGIYFDPGSGSYPVSYAFNNVVNTLCNDGDVYDKSGKAVMYNNDFIVPGYFYTQISNTSGSPPPTYKNNIYNSQTGPSVTSLTASDYNDYYISNTPVITYGGTGYNTLVAFVSAHSMDQHSITSNPNLTSGYIPNSGSPVIGVGVNLYSICNGKPNPGLGALCYDKGGTARPTSAAWDIGAYQYRSGGGTISPPTNLRIHN